LFKKFDPINNQCNDQTASGQVKPAMPVWVKLSSTDEKVKQGMATAQLLFKSRFHWIYTSGSLFI
jgi:hypothetical protein